MPVTSSMYLKELLLVSPRTRARACQKNQCLCYQERVCQRVNDNVIKNKSTCVSSQCLCHQEQEQKHVLVIKTHETIKYEQIIAYDCSPMPSHQLLHIVRACVRVCVCVMMMK